jgi:hypothetical protein
MKTSTASGLILYFELLAGIVGILMYYKQKKSVWLMFAVFLVLLFGMETFGKWLAANKMRPENSLWYNWVVIPSFFYIYHVVYYFILSKKYTKWVVISCMAFLLSAIFENIFLSKEHLYAISISLSIGCLAVLLFSLVYFFGLLKSNRILFFYKEMAFWFCLGLFICYLVNFPSLAFANSLGFKKGSSFAMAYRWVFIFLNYIMYLLFTIGFICSKPKL